MNLNSVLRLTARVTGVREFTKLDRAIKKTEKAARDAEKGFKKMLDSRLFRTAAVAAAGLTAAIALSTKAAVEFESSMADVRKVVDGLDSPKAFAEINQEILELSNNMPIAAQGFADIYAAAGQAGIAREDLRTFAEQVAQVSVAFDMTAEDAGTAMAKIMTSLGLTIPEMTNLADAMNHLSNNSASTAAQLVDFTLRAGQAGQSAGLTAEETAAFGSAMIASGAQADVAATSFRNMIKALSRGPSMTDRQIAALDRLGFAQSDAVANEAVYSDAVRAESEARINIARHETDQLAKELNRRFRDQMTIIRDGLDDQTEEFTEKLQDQADVQIKALQRQQRAEIDAARERAEELDKSAQQEIYAIQDKFDQRIDAVRDKLQDELKERRRADRDRLTAIQDDMNDRKEAELAGLESNFNEIKEREKALMEERLAAIEAQAAAGATAAAEALAKGLQEDAIGTIKDVFDRIRELPKEAQLSLVSDLFGDEARAVLPLINNVDLLEKSLSLVGDQSAYAGSTLNEFLTRVNTTGNQVQQAQNQIQNLSIIFGQTFAPALSSLLTALTPVVESFTWMLQNVPGLAPVIAVLSTAFIGLVAILPALGGLVTVMGAIGAKGAGFAAVGVAIGGIKTALLGVGAVLTGPLGLAALLGVAIGTAYTFRDEIGQVFTNIAEGIGVSLSMARETFVEIFTNVSEFVRNVFSELFNFYKTTFIEPVIQVAESLGQALSGIFNRIADFIKQPFVAAFNFVKSSINNVVQAIAGGVNAAIGGINRVISGANNLPGVNIPLIPNIEIPEFAEGGMVTGPTLGLVGEAGPEYIVPAGKAQAFAQNILAGVRGPAAIPKFAEGGFVAPSSASVSIQTGPVTQMNGQDFVTTADLGAAVEAGVLQTLDILNRDQSIRGSLGMA
jgi:phage-related tail protein